MKELEDISVHLTSSFWPGLQHAGDTHCSNWGKGKRTSVLRYLEPAGWPWLHTLYMLFSTTKPVLPTPPRLLHPALLHPLLCEHCSHHSPSSVILGTGNAVLSDFVSSYYSYWLSLLFDSDCTEGPFCQALQFRTVPGRFLSKVHNSLWLKKARESIFKQS